MNWPKMIKAICESGVPAPDGYRWSYRAIAAEVGLSKSALGRLATGERADPYFTPGKKLVDLYIKVTKEAERLEAEEDDNG